MPFRVIRPNRAKHRAAILDLTAQTFGHPYPTWIHYCCERYIDHSHYDWATSRIGIRNRRVVTHWGVWGYRMRIGSAVVRVGGIGAVATHMDFRKRGLMEQTAPHSIRAMRKAGYDLSILFGIRNFYHRFGYVAAWPENTYFLRPLDLNVKTRPIRLTRILPRQRGILDALYNRWNAGLTGTAVRPTYRNLETGVGETEAWRDRKGRWSGFIVSRKRGNQLEATADGPVDEVLTVLAAKAREAGCDEIALGFVHPASPLARRLRAGTVRVETRFSANGGAMVAVVNLESTLRKMAGELTRRLRGSRLARWSGDLALEMGGQSALLRIRQGRVSVRSGGKSRHRIAGGPDMARLILGSDEPAEVVKTGHIRLTGAARELVPVLFPNQHPMLSRWDRF